MNFGVELRSVLDDCVVQRSNVPDDVFPLGGQRGSPRLEFRGCFFQPLYFGGECSSSLDERGVRSARVGGAAAQFLRRITRFEQAALRERQALIGGTLIVFQPGDRSARFLLTAVEAVTFFLRLRPLEAE